jgi:hypothetical protein
VSFDAIRWAMEQPAHPALTKFCLVAMAECVNAEAAEAVCWPSYSYLCGRTGMNTKTVEQAVFNLKNQGYIVDTGRRAGGTGKVVVYRLNTTAIGCIQPGPQMPDANGTRPQNTTGSGVVIAPDAGAVIPPNTAPNPPKSGDQSPQITRETTPKAGVVIRNGTRNGTRKEARAAIAVTSISGVPERLFSEWMAVREDKRAKTLTQTAADGLLREANKAGLTPEEAVRTCVEHNWVSLNAGWSGVRAAKTSKHAGFAGKDYREGVSEDGSFT